MNKKLVSLLAVSALSLFGLTACGSNNTSSSKDEAKTEQSSSKPADAFTGATAGTTNFDDLAKGLSKDGAWLAAITENMDASGKTLTVSGDFKNKKDESARKLALYAQDADKKVTDRFTLTVDTLKVESPDFYISNGTVKGNVEVDAAGFHGQTGKGVDGQATIEGNLIFKSQELLDTYKKLPAADQVKVTGETKVG